MKIGRRLFSVVLAIVIVIGSALPAISVEPQFETPIQSAESIQLRHIGKFDADSVPDLLFVYQDKLSIRRGLGNGDFGPAIESLLNTQIFNTSSTAVGDLTGDLINDFAFVVPFGKDLQIYRGSAQGTFSFFRTIELDYSVNKTIIGDFNSDSYPDVLITGTGTWGGNYFLEGTASGISSLKSEYKDGFYANGFKCNPALLAKISPSGKPAFLCLGSSAIGIVPMTSATQPGIVAGYDSPYTSYPEERQYAIADFSGDGLLDLAAIRGNSSTLSLLLYENSSLGLNSPKLLNLGNTSWLDQLLTSDINGDGQSDLILFRPNGQTLYSINLGSLKFQSFQPLSLKLI